MEQPWKHSWFWSQIIWLTTVLIWFQVLLDHTHFHRLILIWLLLTRSGQTSVIHTIRIRNGQSSGSCCNHFIGHFLHGNRMYADWVALLAAPEPGNASAIVRLPIIITLCAGRISCRCIFAVFTFFVFSDFDNFFYFNLLPQFLI